MTFEWEEITDELLEKVVFFCYEKSGGGLDATGQPDFLNAITEDGQEYLFGLRECPCVNFEHEIIDRLLGKCPAGLSDHEIAKWRYDRYFKMTRTHEVGKWHWADYYGKNILIRKDYYDKIHPEWKKQLDENGIISVTEVEEMLFGTFKLPRKVLAETLAKHDFLKNPNRDND